MGSLKRKSRDDADDSQTSSEDVSEKRKKTVAWDEKLFKKFDAKEGYHNDHATTCTAKIIYKSASGEDQVIVGSTGKGAGHAEMHALDQFLRNVCDNGSTATFNNFKERGLYVECPAKPCCVRCSIILGALGFKGRAGTYKYFKGSYQNVNGRKRWVNQGKAREKLGDTLKTRHTMGSTEWNLTPQMRKSVCNLSEDLTEQRIRAISDMKRL